MKIMKDGWVIANVPFDIKHIDVNNGDFLIFPYKDQVLVDALKETVTRIAQWCYWLYPDYSKTKIFISDSSLTVGVYPPDYSEDEKKVILSTASKEHPLFASESEYERQWSEYNQWVGIFECVEQGTVGDEGFRSFDIVFTPKEKEEFQDFLEKHMELTV